jgi:hypothetical protein
MYEGIGPDHADEIKPWATYHMESSISLLMPKESSISLDGAILNCL